ncbi:outer membrane lipoprotein-sorting protein [Pseudomonas sp. NPDC089918]|uniref:outer membrane lipoprotein-sorting protein n=1 Tax=Pseudomonas sp. NPDC089918 TaxID=3390654 RepID=UPI003D080666
MKKLNLIALIFSAVIPSAFAQSYTGEQIMLLNEDSRKSLSETSDVFITMTDAQGNVRERTLKLRIDDGDKAARKSYLEFVEPKDVKGTRVLALEKSNAEEDPDRWIYLPALRKVRRIAGADQTQSFVGTDFTYEDMSITDGVVGVKHHSYKILREETIKDNSGVERKCWVVEATPTTKKQMEQGLYGKRIIWVEQQYYTAIQEQYFNKSGQLFKIRTSSDIREFPATAGTTEWRPNLFSMKNLETGHSTQVRFEQVLDQPIDAKIFTRRFMEIGL